MRKSIVPAQITTVEDKVVGNLSLMQLGLVSAPVLVAGALYAIWPPFMAAAPEKVTVVAAVAVMCCTMAIRIRGELVLTLALRRLAYALRPRRSVYDKNDSYLRPDAPPYMDAKVLASLREPLEDEVVVSHEVVFYERLLEDEPGDRNETNTD
jgi:hypothetical protein